MTKKTTKSKPKPKAKPNTGGWNLCDFKGCSQYLNKPYTRCREHEERKCTFPGCHETLGLQFYQAQPRCQKHKINSHDPFKPSNPEGLERPVVSALLKENKKNLGACAACSTALEVSCGTVTCVNLSCEVGRQFVITCKAQPNVANHEQLIGKLREDLDKVISVIQGMNTFLGPFRTFFEMVYVKRGK